MATDNTKMQGFIGARLLAWAGERFPLANALLFLVLYSAAVLFARAQVTPEGGAIAAGPLDILGFFAVWAFFLMLRVFDEHKDYELDCHNHPERVLQSGAITLGHLKVVGVLAIALQAGASWAIGGGWGDLVVYWLVVMGWSTLMAVEFFCGDWLEKRLVLYATSHMLVMPMALVWMAQMGAGLNPVPTTVGWLAGLAFLSGAAFEVTRKMKAPEDERETIDSYTKSLGLKTAPAVVAILLLGGTAMMAKLLYTIQSGQLDMLWLVLLGATVLPALACLFKFTNVPSAKGAKMCEGMVALSMLGGYGILIGAVISERGFAWM